MITRWIFSPLESLPSPVEGMPRVELPVVRQYCRTWNAPWHHEGFALVRCEMDATHLAAAMKDPRLIICGSIHDPAPVHEKIADHHAVHGTKRGHNLRQVLKELEKLHVHFMIEE